MGHVCGRKRGAMVRHDGQKRKHALVTDSHGWRVFLRTHRTLVGVVTTTALLAVAGVTAQAALPSLDSARLPEPTPLLGALKSTAAPAVAGSIPTAGEFPAPEIRAESETPEKFRAPVLKDATFEGDPVARDAFSDTFTVGDGLMATKVSPAQKNMRVDDKWQAIATTFERDKSGGFTADPHPLAPRLAATASEPVLQLTAAGYDVAWRLLDAEKTEASLGEAADTVQYRGVRPGIDLRYTLDGPGLKEEFILKQAPGDAKNTPIFAFEVQSPGLVPTLSEDGSISFLDEKAQSQLSVPTPFMWDASGQEEKQEPVYGKVSFSVEPVASDSPDARSGAYLVTVTPDPEWLLSKDRVYPVTVDPTQWQSGAIAANSWKSDGMPWLGSVHIGNPAQSPTAYWRGFTQWNLSAFSGQVITDSLMAIYYAGSGTGTCQEGYLGGADPHPPSSFTHYGGDLGWFSLCDTYTYASYGSTDWLDSSLSWWSRNGYTNPWLGVRGNESAGVYSYKQIDMDLVVLWHSPPSVTGVTGATPVGGAIGPRVPTMQGTGTDPLGQGLQYRYEFEVAGASENGAGPFTNIAYSSPWVKPGPYTLPSNALQPGTHYRYRVWVKDAADGHLDYDTERSGTNAAWHFTTNQTPVIDPATAVPAVTGTLYPTVVTESGPKFSAPYSERPGFPATTVKYRFTVATGSDGKSGLMADSGWLTPTSTVPGTPVVWDSPDNTLQDGVAYTWNIETDDGVDKASAQAWTGRVKLDRRLGPTGPSPMDTAGPATVNLASGNLALAFSSQQVETLGGGIGMVFSYNSQTDRSALQGLTGQYFNALDPAQTTTTSFNFAGRTPLFTRTDAAVNFDWGATSPAPAVPADYFMVRWSGFINPPTAGTYTFGVAADDGVRVSVGGSLALTRWASGTGTFWSTPRTLPAGPTPILAEFFEAGANASVQLRVKGTGIDPAAHPDGIPIPASWFTRSPEVLPGGWAASRALGGAAGVYVKAQVTEGSVAVTDVTGATHSYVKASTGAYLAPAGEAGSLALDGSGLVTLTDGDGTVYAFDAQGALISATAPSDGLKPATPTLEYRSNGLLASITDPVDGRKLRFAYGGDTNQTVGLSGADGAAGDSACPVPGGTGFASAPGGMLCRIVYPDHVAGASGSNDTSTRIFYNSLGQLAAIVEPGAAQVSLGYTDGLLSRVQNVAETDWLKVHPEHVASNQVGTEITYDTKQRVTSVTLSAPDGVTAAQRPKRSYSYGSGESWVDIKGLNTSATPLGHAGHVTYDTLWRATGSTSPLGLSASRQWHTAKDLVLASTDTQGLVSTTIYDAFSDLPLSTYGPAPASCFTPERTPVLTGCPVVVAHTTTATDEGLSGLHTSYWPNSTFTGAPKLFSLGLTGGSGGIADRNWAAGSPHLSLPSNNFSVRMTGTITLPDSGYQLVVPSDDGVRVWVDDQLVLDDLSAGAATRISTPIASAPGERHRIRVDYFELSGSASLALQWRASPASAASPVPSAALAPDYRLATSSVTHDTATVGTATALTSRTQYGDSPWLGAQTAVSIDPAGLNLTTGMTFEAPSTNASTWLRRLTRTMPSGAGSTTTTAYAQRQLVTAYGDHNRDGYRDLLVAEGNGKLFSFAGEHDGTFASPKEIGTGWQEATALFQASDFDSDAYPDLIRRQANGDLWLHPGNPAKTTSKIGNGWAGFNMLVSPGDFTGDGKPDVLARAATGNLYLYAGNGAGGWASGTGVLIGSGWGGYTVTAAGDFDGNGTSDLIGRFDSTGALVLFRGNGAAAWLAPSAVTLASSGWAGYSTVVGGSDFTRDGKPDLLGVTSTGIGKVHTGTGTGSINATGITILNGLNSYSRIGDFTGAAIGSGGSPAFAPVTASYCGVPQGASQHGFATRIVGPAPAIGNAVATEYAYDVMGRTVGSKRSGDADWSCTKYDTRGRVVEQTSAAFENTPGRTATTSHAVGGNPMVTQVTDSTGTITTETDVLGRTVRSEDVWGTRTEPAYEPLTGRMLSVTVTPPTGPAHTLYYDYDVEGKVVEVRMGGKVIAAPDYNTATQLLTSVAYGNGVELASITRAATGATTGLDWNFPSTQNDVAVNVVRSQSGRITQATTVDGAVTETGTYTFDTAGRLTQANLQGAGWSHQLGYEFAGSSGCGVDTAAGLNGNRTGYTDAHTQGGITSVTRVDYCYDHADRLTATSVTGASAGASAIYANNLTTTGATPNLTYDAHGNTALIAGERFGYDSEDRHLTTTLADGTVITYKRDASDTIVSRTVAPATGPATVVRYSGGGGIIFVLDGANSVMQAQVTLPGGVILAVKADLSETWSYPDLRGDVIVTTDEQGTRQGARFSYDPFGQPIDPVTGRIGTVTADESLPNNMPGKADQGMVGGHSKLTEHAGLIQVIEMGARVYVPALGRFLSVDPVEGGVTNAYDYPADPINYHDLSGEIIGPLLRALFQVIKTLFKKPASTTYKSPTSLKPNKAPKPQINMKPSTLRVDGTDIPAVPRGVVGRLSENGKGLRYDIPEGTKGLHANVSEIRIMNPITTGKYTYPNGYAVYMNEGGRTINPLTGELISNSHAFAHIPLQ